ncbi:rhodanese-like domain-containing protein [Pseudopedobacter beijingensis]|uniref:Rhodanese-like domain-containing protein n=1 Tax=Pseudopedobacter beijingensis TaxID=1207056 RepID=A0ABW4IBU1_9SPHI
MKNIIVVFFILMFSGVSAIQAEEVVVPLPLDLVTFEKSLESRSFIVLDTRSAKEFAEGHIKKSVFLGVDGPFETWLSIAVPDKNQFILVIADEDKAQNVLSKLNEKGYFHVKGFLKGGIDTWIKAGKKLQKINEVEAADLEKVISGKNKQVLDVRKPEEYRQGHLVTALNNPLSELPAWSQALQNKNTYYVHCASGYRSMIAVSLLQLHGAKNVVNVKGGYQAIQTNQNLKIESQ